MTEEQIRQIDLLDQAEQVCAEFEKNCLVQLAPSVRGSLFHMVKRALQRVEDRALERAEKVARAHRIGGLRSAAGQEIAETIRQLRSRR